jgi:hypothetical protein
MPHFFQPETLSKERGNMLDLFTPEQKASILVQILREESEGHNLRDCCRAQGITVQTFMDWQASARRHNQFDTLHMRGVHPERKPAPYRRERQDKPKTALQLALENAQRRTYPADNPDDLHAAEHGEPDTQAVHQADTRTGPPETRTAPPLPPGKADLLTEPPEPASAPDNPIPAEKSKSEPDKPQCDNEDMTVPKATTQTETTGPRGIAGAMYKRMPWLAAVEKKTEKALGPKPGAKEPGYGAWLAHRKELMTDEQKTEMEGFFGIRARREKNEARAAAPKAPVKRAPKPAQLAEQREIAATRAKRAPVSPEVQSLTAQHAEVSSQLAEYEAPRVTRSAAVARAEAGEIERLKKALMALTLENLQLRGLL